jgi:hypothetical protein
MVGDRKVTHSDFAALRHDVLKRFKGASLYKVSRSTFYKNINDGMSLCDRAGRFAQIREYGMCHNSNISLAPRQWGEGGGEGFN